jgi:hypothetical protein
MTPRLRSSSFRAFVGTFLLLVGLVIALFVLPDASKSLEQKRRAADQAQKGLADQISRLVELEQKAERIHMGQKYVDQLDAKMPKGSIGELQWTLSKTLYDMAKTQGVRLQSVKYGLPGREGLKGTDIENLDVEFTAVGVYQSLKKFMLALEGSGLPFGVSTVKLEESAEGARQTVTLRAFRRSSNPKSESAKEDS